MDEVNERKGVRIMKSVTFRKTCLCLFWIILFLMQNRLQQWFEPFQYIDELFALLIVPIFLFRRVREKYRPVWTKKKVIFSVLLLIFWLCGWGGYFLYHYQPLTNAAKDAYVNVKFFMAVGASFLMFDCKDLDFDELKRRLWPVLKGITILLFVLCLADLCFGIFSTETRGGLRAVKLFYSTYTILVGLCSFLCALCLWFYEQQQKRIIPLLAMLSFVMYTTRRVKAMGAVACILLVYLFVFNKRHRINKKVRIFVGCILGLAVIAGLYQIIWYYFTLRYESARAVLTIAAPFIAVDHFPFGTGWGAYASAFSVEPYSPVYGIYGMSSVWGISQANHSFISDTYWPMILGQCGILGFAAFLGALVLFVRKALTLKTDKNAYAAVLISLLYLLISSSSESALVNPIAIPFAFLIGLLLAEKKVREEKSRRLAGERK